MPKEILRVPLTHNVKQLKKYVDDAISKGAEEIFFNMDANNPYFIFFTDFTPEQENEYELEKLKKEYSEKIKSLEEIKFKTYSFRIKQYGLSDNDVTHLVKKFMLTNKIKNCSVSKIKQVITNTYDDFEDRKQTVFITEVIGKK